MQKDVYGAPSYPRYQPLFDVVYDVVVYGAGWIGFSAARALAAKGCKVLLLAANGDLLWESSRSLEMSVASSGTPAAWQQWDEAMRARNGASEGEIDGALAEIMAADELYHGGSNLKALLYAPLVSVQEVGVSHLALTVATKGGWRVVQTRFFIDTSDSGTVGELFNYKGTGQERTPEALRHTYVLHSKQPEVLDEHLRDFLIHHPELCWQASALRPTERRVSWLDDGRPWHEQVLATIRRCREVAEGARQYGITHCSLLPFPLYGKQPDSAARLEFKDRYLYHGPRWGGGFWDSVSARFEQGARVGELASVILSGSMTDVVEIEPLVPPASVTYPEQEVVVVGTGTGGAMAAFAAAECGGKVLALDMGVCPGGIGTGGGITGYFYGNPGGLQSMLDDETAPLTELFNGYPSFARGWHHDAKKLALLSLYAEKGVTFQGNAFMCDVRKSKEGAIESILAVVDERLVLIPGRMFIDATGDADLCALAGASYLRGREGDRRTLAYSQPAFELTESSRGLHVQTTNFDAGWVDASDPEDLTQARLLGLAQYLSPKGQVVRPLALAPTLGVRQSRHVLTDATVTLDSLVMRTRFADAIGVVKTIADTHSVDYEFEDDEMAFYYWSCRGFKSPQQCDLPYGMMLPKGLTNVWVACRAAGMDVNAAYGLRMQREMQRLGEAAGRAAVLAVRSGLASREVPLDELRDQLRKSGALLPEEEAEREMQLDRVEPLDSLAKGIPGIHLWRILRDPKRYRNEVLKVLRSEEKNASFYAATILAMWREAEAEPRLLEALEDREVGLSPDVHRAVGAYGQCIDLPYWLLAVLFLRRCGTLACLPALHELACSPGNLLNVRTLLARSLEKLAEKLGPEPLLLEALDALLSDPVPDAVLPPSRSLWAALHGEQQKKLPNDRGAPTAQDHSWQLHLLVNRTRLKLGLSPLVGAEQWLQDPRGFVRHSFEELDWSLANSVV